LRTYHQITFAILAAVFLLLSGCASQTPLSEPSLPADENISSPQTNGADSEDNAETLISSYVIDSQRSLNEDDTLADDYPQNLSNGNMDNDLDSDSGNNETLLENDTDQVIAADQKETAVHGSKISSKKEQPLLDKALAFCEVAQDFWQKGELENALNTLDEAYALILTVDTEADPKLFQQKEDLRYLISKRILEIYASRNIVVNGNHDAIPLDMNRHVESELKLFTTGAEHNFFQEAYDRSGQYRPYIIQALKEAGLPEELSWVPLIESGFKVKALSRARALGLWQFIPSTGYKFGLKRDKFIDERIDPYKATAAAISYLKELHNMFGDWATVLAAYNCGEGRVLRVIRTQNINYLDNFWDLYERLPRETARYVPRFMATLHIVKNPAKYGLDTTSLTPQLAHETIEVNRQVHLKDIAKTIDMTYSDLKNLNPELRYNILPPEPYPLKVAPGKEKILLSKIDTISLSTPPQLAYVWHKVRSGETLSTIARRYRTSVRSIMNANGLRRSHYIMAGKKLKIPRRGYSIMTASSASASKDTPTFRYRVRRGDSLWVLAKRYGTTTKTIQNLNHLSSTRLYIGQKLNLPDRNSASGAGIYHVRKGDNPAAIARQHNMSLTRLLQLNNLTTYSKIYPGQQLAVE
jgi:membrane-bound lytic murein transglycosylase D